MKKYLVEITTKVTNYFAKSTFHLKYIEVEAHSEYQAKVIATLEYEKMLKYCKNIRKDYFKVCTAINDYCAADAVEI